MPNLQLPDQSFSVTNVSYGTLTLEANAGSSVANLYPDLICNLVNSNGTSSIRVMIKTVDSSGVVTCLKPQFSDQYTTGKAVDLTLYNGGSLYIEAQLAYVLADVPVATPSTVGSVPHWPPISSDLPLATGTTAGAMSAAQDVQLSNLQFGSTKSFAGLVQDDAYVIATAPFANWSTHVTGSATINLTGGDGYNGAASSVLMTTDGNSGACYIDSPAITLDATGMRVNIAVKIAARSKLLSSAGTPYLAVYFSNSDFSNFSQFYLDDVYGASVQPIWTANEWTQISFPWPARYVSGSPTRNSVTKMRIRVWDVGGNGGSTTVQIGKISLVADMAARYPTGAATIHFDDGYDSVYTLAYPLMAKRAVRGVCHLITDQIGAAGKMTASQLTELANAGWDICSHAPTLAIHTATFPGTNYAALVAALTADRAYFTAQGWNSNFIAYPGGFVDIGGATNGRTAVVAAGYKAARTIFSNINGAYPPTDPYMLHAKTTDNTTTVATIATIASQLATAPAHLGFVFHQLTTGSADTATKCTTANFAQMLDSIIGRGVAVRTLSELIG